jgi:putative intracellular protease/amidase
MSPRTKPRQPTPGRERIIGFRLGIYVFKDAEIVDFAAPYGVFSVARRFDPALDVFLVAEALRPVQAQAGFTVVPNYGFSDQPAMDAFLIPGGAGTRPETYNRRLHDYVRSLPESTLLTSVCTGSWIYAQMGLLDGIAATSRKEPDRQEAAPPGMVPIDRLAALAPACKVSRAQVVDAGRIVTAGGLQRAWRLASSYCVGLATMRASWPRWPGSWSTPGPTRRIGTTGKRFGA